MKKVLFALAIIPFFASCGVKIKSQSATRTIHIDKRAIDQVPLIAELDVDTKSPIRYHENNVKLKSKHGEQFETVKAIVLKDAARENGADIVIDPVFNFEKTGRSRYKVTVDGLKGSYSKIRPLTKTDIEIMETRNELELKEYKYISTEKETSAYGRKKLKRNK